MKTGHVALAMALTLGILFAQSADELVSQGLDAIGGEAKLKETKSRQFEGKVVLGGGAVSGSFFLIQKRPNKLLIRIEANGLETLQAFDGEQAWQLIPTAFGGLGSAEALSGKAADTVAQNAVFESQLIDYKKKGHQIELVGKETVEGLGEVHHLELTTNDGKSTHFFMDAETRLLKMISRQAYVAQAGADLEVAQIFDDYRRVEGTMVAHRFTTKVSGQVVSEFTVTQVKLNGEIPDAEFKKPSTPAS